jgi:hypothetical protein
MTRRWLMLLITVNLLALLALVFAYPHLMVAPGHLVDEHAELATDCFACHTALRGVSAQKCIACHAVKDIGLRSSKGLAITGKTGKAIKTAFHQELTEQNCVACHSDHAGPRLVQKDQKPFSHALLRLAVRDQCQSCHQAPNNTMHKAFTGECKQCHSQQAWKPATFDHAKLFVLDGDHQTECATCHVKNDYSRYTCYGCHEHQASGIAAKHQEEGIQNFDNCVECHRSAKGEPQGKGDGNGKGREKGQGKEHD